MHGICSCCVQQHWVSSCTALGYERAAASGVLSSPSMRACRLCLDPWVHPLQWQWSSLVCCLYCMVFVPLSFALQLSTSVWRLWLECGPSGSHRSRSEVGILEWLVLGV